MKVEIKEFINYKNNDMKKLINLCNDSLDKLYEGSIWDLKERTQYRKIKDSGNLALAILYKDGGKETTRYIAHSKFNDEESMHYLDKVSSELVAAHYYKLENRGKVEYKTKVLDRKCSPTSKQWDRDVDTESKIIEKIKSDYPENLKGQLILWTKKYPCPSCRGVIEKFSGEYSELKITILYSKRDLSSPCECKGGEKFAD